MAVSRYDERMIITNNTADYRYSKIFSDRGLRYVRQYTSAEFKKPTKEELGEIIEVKRVWGVGTKFFKLSYEFYGEPDYWWIIAWYNFRPLEQYFRPGDIVIIPTPLETTLSMLGML